MILIPTYTAKELLLDWDNRTYECTMYGDTIYMVLSLDTILTLILNGEGLRLFLNKDYGFIEASKW